MMQHNNTANTHISLRALAIISTSTKLGVSANTLLLCASGELVCNKVNVLCYFRSRLFYSIQVCNKVQYRTSTFTCTDEVHWSCTFANITKYPYFVIFLALLFLAIVYSTMVDVVCMSWRLVEIQPIKNSY